MEKLTTPRLLAYKNSLHAVPESPDWEESMYGGPVSSGQINKTTPAWMTTMATLKVVLKDREHVVKGRRK